MIMTRRQVLLSSVSVAALVGLSVSPASAYPTRATFDTTTDTITFAGTGHTTVSGNTATTDSTGESVGARMTGSGTGAYIWDINGNLTPVVPSGFTNDTSAGTTNVNINAVTVNSTNSAGISVLTTGNAVTTLNLTGTTVTSSAGEGIYVNSTSTGATHIITDLATTILNSTNGSDAAINVVSSAVGSTIDNDGRINGNTSSGYGIHLQSNALIDTLTNRVDGEINSGPGHNAIDIQSHNGSGAGVNLINNYGFITAEAFSTGDGIAVHAGGNVTTIRNYGLIQGTDGSAISVSGGHIGTIDNYGGLYAGSSNGTIYVGSGGTLDTINNYATGSIGDLFVPAINLTNAASTGTTINTAGNIDEDIHLGSDTGSGDVVNVYGGAISGTIYGCCGEGNVGTINFDLIGGTFGIDGTSVDGTFETGGDLGTDGHDLEAVNVNSGVLVLDNNIDAGTVTIASGATLLINANNKNADNGLVNNGTLDLQNNTFGVGYLFGTGTLALHVQAGSGGAHGNIAMVGESGADLTSMTIAPYFTSGDVTPGETLVIVSNPTELGYDPSKALSSYGIKWILSTASSSGTDYQGYSYGSGSLLATSESLTYGVAPGNVNAINALENYCGCDPDLYALQVGLNSTGDGNKVGAQIQPNANGGIVEGALNASGQTQDVISMHLQNFNGSTGASSGELSAPGTGYWMQGLGSFASQGTISGIDGFRASTYGMTFGGDKEVRNNIRLGAAFTYANTMAYDKGERSGSNEGIDSYLGNIYGTYRAHAWYADGMLTYGVHDYRTTRLVDFITPVTEARGSFAAQQYGAKAEVGYPMAVRSFTVTPLAAFAYDNVHDDGYTETGAGGANLVVGSTSTNSYRTTLGTKVSKQYTLNDSWQMKPTLLLAWKHEFNDKLVPDQDVSFSGGGLAFTTPGLKLSQDALDFGVNVDLASARNLTLSAKYDGELRSNYINQAGVLKARFDF